MPPVIAARLHGDFLLSAAGDDDGFDDGGLLQGGIDGVFEADDFAAQPGAILRDEHAALGVLDAVGERLLGEAAIDDAMWRARFWRRRAWR